MQEVTFDTHAAIRKLEGAGCPAEQAEAMVAMVSEATGLTAHMARDLEHLRLWVETNMATKADVAALRAETQEGLAALRSEFKGGIAALRTETQDGFAALRSESKGDVAALRTGTQDGFAALRSETQGDIAALRIDTAEHRAETRAGFAALRERIDQIEERMVTKGELYRALWIQGGVLATLILSLAAITLGFALYAMTGP